MKNKNIESQYDYSNHINNTSIINMIILIILIILVLLNFYFIKSKLYNSEDVVLDDVKLKEESSNNGFALMLEQKNDDGTTSYVESADNIWPSNEIYFFNSELSGCVDINGNKLDNVLSFDSNTNLATIKTKTTTFCYLYFDIDKVSPNISIFYLGGSSNPLYATSTSSTAYISWSDIDVASYCLTTSSSSTNCTWITTSGTSVNSNYTLTSGDGTKTVYAYLKDKAGNVSSSVLDTIILDTTAPVINSVTKTSDATTSISISVSASDTNGIQTYYYQIGSGSVVSNTTGTYTFSNLTAGTSYTIKVYVKDKAGNTSSTKSYTFKTKTNSLAEKLISNVTDGDLWNSTLEGDGYRYVGTNPNNYICFGTSDMSTCTSDTDKYMYRIIGIFEDSSGNKHLKLIKKSSIGSNAWHSQDSNEVAWNESDLYKGLNGIDGGYYTNLFVNNDTYDYMAENSTWYNKIATWNYTMTNTKTYESSGPNYYTITTEQMYLHELNRSGKSSSIGEWITLNTKISLIYASDYALSLGSNALNYTTKSNYKIMETGWMYIGNNDSNTLHDYEWTMSRHGIDSSYYGAWAVYAFELIDSSIPTISLAAVRPVFYLKNDVELASNTGDGSITNPYIIKE